MFRRRGELQREKLHHVPRDLTRCCALTAGKGRDGSRSRLNKVATMEISLQPRENFDARLCR